MYCTCNIVRLGSAQYCLDEGVFRSQIFKKTERTRINSLQVYCSLLVRLAFYPPLPPISHHILLRYDLPLNTSRSVPLCLSFLVFTPQSTSRPCFKQRQ